MRVRYRARALADIDEIRRSLQNRSPSGARNVRVKVIVQYPYKVFYSVHAEQVEILHVRHSARRPWEEER